MNCEIILEGFGQTLPVCRGESFLILLSLCSDGAELHRVSCSRPVTLGEMKQGRSCSFPTRWGVKDLLELSSEFGVVLCQNRSVLPEGRSPSESVARKEGIDIGHFRTTCGKPRWGHLELDVTLVQGSPASKGIPCIPVGWWNTWLKVAHR
ncbi:hypothetical protein FKM82_030510 [Ascaphus truei]